MKKLLLCSMAAGMLVFAACKKEKEPEKGPEKAPESYTQKMVLEYFSGAWCTFCPDGTVYSDAMTEKYGANVFYPVTIHYGTSTQKDNMAFTEGLAINSLLNKAGYPTGMINRMRGTAVSRTLWNPMGDSIITNIPKAGCGLSIDATAKNGNVYTVKVKLGVGKTDLPAGNYYLLVYGITSKQSGNGSGWDQINYYNSVSGHPYFGKGNPILGYEHKNALNAVLTAKENGVKGKAISADQIKAGALNEFTFDYDVTGKNGSGFYVLAHIYRDGNTIPGSQPFIMNAQKCNLGESKSFD